MFSLQQCVFYKYDKTKQWCDCCLFDIHLIFKCPKYKSKIDPLIVPYLHLLLNARYFVNTINKIQLMPWFQQCLESKDIPQCPSLPCENNNTVIHNYEVPQYGECIICIGFHKVMLHVFKVQIFFILFLIVLKLISFVFLTQLNNIHTV